MVGTLALLGILVTIMGPRVAAVSNHVRVETAARQLVADLEWARTEAIKRNRPIGLRPTGDHTYEVDSLGVRSLDGIVFTAVPESVQFAAFGPPLTGAATFELTAGTHSISVFLNPAGYTRTE